MTIRYVLTVVIHPELPYVIGLTKQSGPEFLIGKLTFPGGKIEKDEDIGVAASRELLEETGVQVGSTDWRLVRHDKFRSSDAELYLMAATSRDVFGARSCESEPVWQLATSRHLEYARRTPEKYAPDFIRNLEQSLHALGLAVQNPPSETLTPSAI